MIRFTLSLLAITVAGFFGVMQADDKKEEQPLKGSWVRTAEDLEIGFQFKTKDELIVTAKHGDNGVTITCKYTVKDGQVSAEVTEVKEQGEFPAKPPKGYKMKFKFKIEKDTAKLSDYEADNAEQVKPIIEGDYKPKKSD